MAKQKEPYDINFEIKFYEKVLKESPDFVEVLLALGDLYTRAGFYEKGLRIDQRLTKLRPQEAIVFYNLACSHSLLNNLDAACESLSKAIDLGYNDWQFMSKDPDLEKLRKDERFQGLLTSLKSKK
ncbi:MAG: hypothetical protein Q8N14_06555 [Candidatus Omnitrophota bacterium]|nr:hypothetical protein [Candidatus Omnitrophota bacterium]